MNPQSQTYDEANLVWIFGHPRSGTTWTAKLLADALSGRLLNEPGLGNTLLFRSTIEKNDPTRLDDPTFWFSEPNRERWQPVVNDFFHAVLGQVLIDDGDGTERPNSVTSGIGPHAASHVVIKEPNSTAVAPLVASIMPRAKVVVMIRDPRDVTASLLDARKPGAWMDQRVTADFDRDTIVRQTITRFQKFGAGLRELRDLAQPGQLYEMHYERLRTDTEAELVNLFHWFGFDVDPDHRKAVIETHAYENIPTAERGPGQFIRNAVVGGWRNELEPAEITQIEHHLRRYLDEHDYDITRTEAGAAG